MDELPEISVQELAARLRGPKPPVLIDVRLPWEHQLVALPGSRLIPLHELPARADELEALRGQELVVYCHHGVRSLTGTSVLLGHGHDAKSLSGGIDAYAAEISPSLPRY